VTPLPEGSAGPDFELRDQHGAGVRLSAHRGDRPVLLVFYPWAFSRVCGSELRALRDGWPALGGDDVALLAVSCDPVHTLRAYAEEEGLDFPLLSDFWPHGVVSTAYGVFDADRGCAARSSYLLDRAGTVVWSLHHAMGEERPLEEYRAAFQTLER